MKAWFLVLLAGLLAVVGCGTQDRSAELRQEQLLLDLMKSQNDQLAQLMQRQGELRGMAEKNDEALKEIARQKAALAASQQEVERNRRAAEEAIAQDRAKLQTASEQLEAEKKQLQAQREKNQKAEREIAARRDELSRLQARIQPAQRAAGRPPHALSPSQADSARSPAKVDARVKRRQPYLEELASLTAGMFPSPKGRSSARSDLMHLFDEEKIAETKEDDAFVDAALGIAESFYLERTKYPYLTHERKVFDQWGQKYLKAAAS